jgi:general secretion pathway protein D
LIAEVRKDRSIDFGVDVSLPPQPVHGHERTTVGVSTTGAPGLADFVMRIMKIGNAGADVTLRAAVARGDVRIVSRPIVIATNNEEAEIHVGSQRPFVQVSRVLPTDNTARDQIVQYKDVGTRLSVRPTISADGYVMLRLIQEVNQVTQEASGLAGVQAPVISARSVQTHLLIKDRQTVVIGGLSDQQRDVNQGGIPVLSSIPWLGGLFGHASRRTIETELLLFLTPRVIRDDGEAEQLTDPLRRKADEAKP